jgi:hypothetical protein
MPSLAQQMARIAMARIVMTFPESSDGTVRNVDACRINAGDELLQ